MIAILNRELENFDVKKVIIQCDKSEFKVIIYQPQEIQIRVSDYKRE